MDRTVNNVACRLHTTAQPSPRPAKQAPKLPPRISSPPEHDEELEDEELIKAIRHLAGLT